MVKIDLTKTHKQYFSAKATPEIVVFEQANYISIRGKGDPSGKEFSFNVEALFPVAYALKFDFKSKMKDFAVAKLEGLWWYDEKKYTHNTMVNASYEIPRSEWEYRLLIMMPHFVKEEDFLKAREITFKKKKSELIHRVEFYPMIEGKCVQMLHVGPYSTEPETLRRMAEFIQENKLQRNGVHHEIYLSDFRKTPSEKLKTVLREPVR